jgi:hypothetical protein
MMKIPAEVPQLPPQLQIRALGGNLFEDIELVVGNCRRLRPLLPMRSIASPALEGKGRGSHPWRRFHHSARTFGPSCSQTPCQQAQQGAL